MTSSDLDHKNAFSTGNRLMLAWVIAHNSHGVFYENPVWLPEGVRPDNMPPTGSWIRAPWLDQKPTITQEVSSESRRKLLAWVKGTPVTRDGGLRYDTLTWFPEGTTPKAEASWEWKRVPQFDNLLEG